jgi:hypothetical protein
VEPQKVSIVEEFGYLKPHGKKTSGPVALALLSWGGAAGDNVSLEAWLLSGINVRIRRKETCWR